MLNRIFLVLLLGALARCTIIAGSEIFLNTLERSVLSESLKSKPHLEATTPDLLDYILSKYNDEDYANIWMAGDTEFKQKTKVTEFIQEMEAL